MKQRYQASFDEYGGMYWIYENKSYQYGASTVQFNSLPHQYKREVCTGIAFDRLNAISIVNALNLNNGNPENNYSC